MLDKNHILNRFIGYVKIDTESDPNSTATPSTEKQWDLAHKLADELKAIGMQDVSIDANAYIMATLAIQCCAQSTNHRICISF